VRRVAIGAALLLAGCAGPDRALEARLAGAIADAGRHATPWRVDGTTDFAWDTLHVFLPYTPPADIERALGFAWPDATRTGIESADTFDLWVFVRDRRVVRWVALPRSAGEFGRMKDHASWRPDRAVFKVKRGGAAPTWWTLMPS
jgi:hypothetical protein